MAYWHPFHKLKIYQSRWHIVATMLFILVPFAFLMAFSRVAHIQANQLSLSLAVSLWRIAIAYLISAFLGWACAVLFYRGKRATVALPVFDLLQSFPTYAALPIATLYWGPSNLTVIFFLVLAIIWPIFFSVVSSLKLIRRDWEEAVEISGLRGIDYLRYFVWPVSKPGLITGSIIGLGDGWEALVATEIIIGVKSGLGNFFQAFNQNITITALGILGFLLIIFSINKLFWLPLLEMSHRDVEE